MRAEATAEDTRPKPDVSSLPPEALAFAARMFDAARNGQMDVFEQALPAGLPPNLTNEKGDSLVCDLLDTLLLPAACPLDLFLRGHFGTARRIVRWICLGYPGLVR